jgi:hypothetical protein
MRSGKKLSTTLVANLRLNERLRHEWSNNHEHFTPSSSTTAVDEIARSSYARLDPHNNGLNDSPFKTFGN